MPSRDPSRFGQCTFGHARFDVYTKHWERKIKPWNRDFTRRRRRMLQRDTATGWYRWEWLEDTVSGILSDQGTQLPAFASGVVMRGDAVFMTMAGFRVNDQLFDDELDHTYLVTHVDNIRDPKRGGFALRVCHLHLQELYKEHR